MLNLLTDGLLAEVFSWLGPLGTGQCSQTTGRLQRVAYSSRTLWRTFVQRYFGLEGNENVDWRAVYAYLATRSQQRAAYLPPGRVVFADDGSCIPGYPPENALRLDRRLAWCTNSGVDQDVDLVVSLTEPTLVSGFVAENVGGMFYSAPMKEALVFCSPTPIDLDAARQFNGKNGSKWVTKLQKEAPNKLFFSQTSRDTTMDPVSAVPSYTSPQLVQPKAAFQFPDPAYNMCLQQRCPPSVARFVHFKLLSSHKCTRGRPSDNIDVKGLYTFGVPLPELPALLQEVVAVAPDPSYRRQHEVREYTFYL